jgi:hypothetical protein
MEVNKTPFRDFVAFARSRTGRIRECQLAGGGKVMKCFMNLPPAIEWYSARDAAMKTNRKEVEKLS